MQRRAFAQAAPRRSAWPLGRDASPGAQTTQEETLGQPVPRQSLPPGERAITLRDIEELKARGEPM